MVQLVKETGVEGQPADVAELRSSVRVSLEDLTADYSTEAHGIEIRQVRRWISHVHQSLNITM